MKSVHYCRLALSAAFVLALAGCESPAFEFQKGDHLVIVGNALADRMQHDGWMEAYLQAELPGHELVIRNHGFTGDRVDDRPRSRGFPTAGDYLSLSEANVIFAMFGYNESFDDDPQQFGQALASWVDSTVARTYSDKGPPRIVLFSPIAHEDLNSSNFPDGSDNNIRLAAISEMTKTVAEAKALAFVDLFSESQKLYNGSSEPLTINGIHLTTEGNRQIGRVLAQKLLGHAPRASAGKIEGIRQAVLDKNWHWFNRYRATDGNDVWGSRSVLAFTDDQTNFEVLQRELVQLDYMTANRDPVIWAAANGESIQPDDSNVPEPIEVITNLDEEQLQEGVSVVGSVEFLTAEEAIGKMRLQPGLSVNLFASEDMFPELVNPVQLGVDTRGRMWAATWATYPKWEPTKKMDDRLLILPDENRDGVADTAITFAYVHNPTGFEFWNGGVIVASVPDLLFLKDTDGDDVADVRINLMGALGSADTHHSANNFVYGPDGFLYYQRGIFNVSNIETPWSANQVNGESGMYRFNPRTSEFSFHAANPPNAHGIDFDYWGYHYATDATGGRAFQVKPSGDGLFAMRKLLENTVRPVPSSGIISSAHLPPSFEGNFIILNVIAFLGIKQYELAYDTALGNVTGTETSDLLVTDDLNFRPSDFEIGDEGALYVSDWANAIIGHMQHNIRDPSRDHEHGRIYRITAPGRPLSNHVAIHGEPISELLKVLEHPINGIRRRARVELSARNTAQVIAAAEEWLSTLDPQSEDDAHHMLEGLWLYQQHNVVNRDLLAMVLNSPVAHARIAARTVQYMWDYSAATSDGMVKAEPEAEAETVARQPDADAIVIRTVSEQMRYDTPTFRVRAGQKVKLWFENNDFMPHNLVIGQPGSADEIGSAADAMGGDGFAAQFIPDNDKVIVATQLISYEDYEVLEFTAPAISGVYEVLCTFPGHRGTMNAKMEVMK